MFDFNILLYIACYVYDCSMPDSFLNFARIVREISIQDEVIRIKCFPKWNVTFTDFSKSR